MNAKLHACIVILRQVLKDRSNVDRFFAEFGSLCGDAQISAEIWQTKLWQSFRKALLAAHYILAS